VNRFGRVAWVAQRSDGAFEVHRADLAGRDMVLDTGTRIHPESLIVRRGKLRWRNGNHVRTGDFDGQRGDRAPIDDPRLRIVPGESEVHGPGPKTWRFAVEVEDGLPIDDAQFARVVEDILFAPDGWLGRGSRLSLQRVDRPPFDFRVTLAKPRTVDRLCLPLHTVGRVSCENRGRSVINWLRWSTGSPWWTNERAYRAEAPAPTTAAELKDGEPGSASLGFVGERWPHDRLTSLAPCPRATRSARPPTGSALR
jgi:hypothetical protein